MASVNDLVRGLQILAKYMEGGMDAHIGGAEHDVIFSGPHLDVSEDDFDEDGDYTGDHAATGVSEDDRRLLEEFGWHIDSDNQSWARFC